MQANTPQKIRVVLLDDHPMIRLSFDIAARREPDMEVMASFSQSKDLLQWLSSHRADVLVLDYILEGHEVDGLTLIKQILARHPDQRILLSSSMESLAVIHAALLAGVKGYVNKREDISRYFHAVRQVAAGKCYLSAEQEAGLLQLPARRKNSASLDARFGDDVLPVSKLLALLTPRESEILRLFLDGLTVQQISDKLKRSRKTISCHKQSGMKKLGIASDPELFKYREDLFK
ncbi:response regulator transcription factor [Cedecea neteri]|uniref:response regulator transcription factor n=1 Tax=Cedecea neteri TaxID=158822 RepID=UPI0028933EB6|nr:response regulator transcription factor [Cedecea neteri]WNJ78471.1 response regulator transcription factor [Cedecea neteri]